MERGGGDDSVRAVGMCDRFLTFLAKNLSMNRPKNITEGPRNGGDSGKNHEEDKVELEDDEFTIEIEKAEFDFSQEEDDDVHQRVAATILGERNADVGAPRAAASGEHKPEEAAADHPAAAEAAPATAPAAAQEKVRRSVTIKDEREEAGDNKDAAATGAKRTSSLFKRRQASSSQLGGAGGEEPRPVRRPGLRPRVPSMPRVPSNINERSATFIEERKKSFGRGKPEK